MKEPDSRLLEILVCPADKSKLELSENKTEFKCLKCKNRYKIIHGMPVMLLPEIKLKPEK